MFIYTHICASRGDITTKQQPMNVSATFRVWEFISFDKAVFTNGGRNKCGWIPTHKHIYIYIYTIDFANKIHHHTMVCFMCASPHLDSKVRSRIVRGIAQMSFNYLHTCSHATMSKQDEHIVRLSVWWLN